MTDIDSLHSIGDIKEYISSDPAVEINKETGQSLTLRIPEYSTHRELKHHKIESVHHSVSTIVGSIIRLVDDGVFSTEVEEKEEGSSGKVAYLEITKREA